MDSFDTKHEMVLFCIQCGDGVSLWESNGDEENDGKYLGKLRPMNQMVRVQSLTLMAASMKENGRRGKNTVEEHSRRLKGLFMKGNGWKINHLVKE